MASPSGRQRNSDDVHRQGLELDLVSGWLVVMHTYLYYIHCHTATSSDSGQRRLQPNIKMADKNRK